MLIPYATPAGRRYALYADMLEQPHVLIAGATGSGKSCIINGLLYTALFRAPGPQPGNVNLILIDPKRTELSQWRKAPHVLRYVSEPAQFAPALAGALRIADNRFSCMQRRGDRLFRGGDIYIIIDEWADMLLIDSRVRPLVQRLAQTGRAARIHIVLATQTPIAKVLPTEIKCNFDARVALRTRSAQDSRNILGTAGAETLPKCGHGLYMYPGGLDRYQLPPPYSDSEIAARVQFWRRQRFPLARLFNPAPP